MNGRQDWCCKHEHVGCASHESYDCSPRLRHWDRCGCWDEARPLQSPWGRWCLSCFGLVLSQFSIVLLYCQSVPFKNCFFLIAHVKVVPNNSTIKLEPIRPSKLLTTLWFCHMIVGYCWYMLVWLTSGSWFFRVCHLGRWFHLTDIFMERLGWVAVPKFHKPWIYPKNSHATYALCIYIYI